MWDREVDMVCTGSGAAGLATSVAARALGGDVFVAGSRAAAADALDSWLGLDVSDRETCEYFAALASDLEPIRYAGDPGVPISVVHATTAERRGTVAPFVGSRLGQWAARCISSPYGFLYTRVSDWRTATAHTADGELIEVADLGAISPDPSDLGGSLLAWLTSQADDHDIDIEPDCALQRIVFEEGCAVGAVFDTPDGTLAIGARHGVAVVGPAADLVTAVPAPVASGDAALRVCLVSRHASRFGRVELLASEPLTQSAASSCETGNRALRVNLHETHAESPVWRCGKLPGYPPPTS
ncbi:hypothetical protein [Mycolicibacterium sp. XJ1819]